MKGVFIAGAPVFFLAACGGNGGAKGRMVEPCAEGAMMNRQICTCIADRLQSDLDGRTFTTVANAWDRGPASLNESLSRLPRDQQNKAVTALASATGECVVAGMNDW